MSHEFHWGFLIVLYLFLAGVSAGAFAISGLANYLGSKKYELIARVGAYIAPFPVSLGLLLLLFDLGRPFRFWRLFATIRWTSPMSIGSWLLVIFVTLSLIYFYLWLPDRFRNLIRLPHSFRQIRRPSTWTPLKAEQVRRWKLIIGGIGFPVSIGVGMYTGILLGAIPARPFWNTPMVAQLFLFSAMSSGVGTIIFVLALISHQKITFDECKLLNSVDAALITFEIFLIIPFILHQSLSTWSHKEAVTLIMGGPYTLYFWIGVVFLGILFPLGLEVVELWHLVVKNNMLCRRINLGIFSGAAVIIGGFILRFVFVFAGQASHFLPVY